MKILITGASSFTGTWFASALAARGHQVSATFRGALGSYNDLRSLRMDRLREAGVTFHENCSFGDGKFIELVASHDVVCHHGAEVANYHSQDFDVHAAVAANTMNVRAVMEMAAASDVKAFIATGSVFEQGEGLGEAPLVAFSPYGLSKSLAWEVIDYWGGKSQLPTGKFVIPNPFGPLEEARFCAYLMRCWAKGEEAGVRTPSYIRDNIPVDLLAAAYVDFVEQFTSGQGDRFRRPAGYVGSQGDFARRFADEIGSRLALATPLNLSVQIEFAEPVMRTNSDFRRYDWIEGSFWDAAAQYYRETYLA